MRIFFGSRSGYVRPREGLGVGWLVVALVGLTMLLGSAQEAAADYCYGVPEGSTQWTCNSGTPCYNPGQPGWGTRRLLVFHSPTCCPHCEILDYNCSCF